MLTTRTSVVEVCNVHGERLAKQLSVAEFIDNMRNAPQFAHQEGLPCHSYACTFNQRFS